MRFNLLHWKGLLFDWTVKRGINFKMSDTLFMVSFAVLCSSIGTQLTRKRPPPRGGGEMSTNVCRRIVKMSGELCMCQFNNTLTTVELQKKSNTFAQMHMNHFIFDSVCDNLSNK